MLFFAIGRWSDKIKPTIFLPIAYGFRGVILLALCMLESPDTWICYVLWMLYALAHIMESIGTDGYYAKNVKNEIAGTMWGIMGICSLIG